MALVSTVSFLSVIGKIGVGFQLNNFPSEILSLLPEVYKDKVIGDVGK